MELHSERAPQDEGLSGVAVSCDFGGSGWVRPFVVMPLKPRTRGEVRLAAAGSGLQITLLHADEHEGTVALRRQVVSDVLALPNASIHVWYENGTGSHEPLDGVHAGLMNLADVTLPDTAWYYLCGPIPFMQAVRSALIERGVPPADIQYEVFGPTSGRPTSTERPPRPARVCHPTLTGGAAAGPARPGQTKLRAGTSRNHYADLTHA
jgi:ferredoxin-NADP reductase